MHAEEELASSLKGLYTKSAPVLVIWMEFCKYDSWLRLHSSQLKLQDHPFSTSKQFGTVTKNLISSLEQTVMCVHNVNKCWIQM